MNKNEFYIYGSNFYCGSEEHFYGMFETLTEARKERDFWLKDRHAVYLWIERAILREGKLFRDILSRMEQGNQGNLEEIEVVMHKDGITVNGGQFIPKGKLTNYTARSLFGF